VTAEWRNLAMLNYAIEPSLLLPLVPRGTELDTWRGVTFVSLVGFLFADTRLLGVPVPWHRTFEEVNLRFYVRRMVNGEVRRAVTFIREIVPRRAIAVTARLAYNEPYVSLPMRHVFGAPRADRTPSRVEYGWRHGGEWATIAVQPTGEGRSASPGSQEEFITEHYWGYTRQRDGGTVEYRVAHPSWRVWAVAPSEFTGSLAPLYGADLARILAGPPASAFLADGSPVTVFSPERLV
jgi:uncharacterized protein